MKVTGRKHRKSRSEATKRNPPTSFSLPSRIELVFFGEGAPVCMNHGSARAPVWVFCEESPHGQAVSRRFAADRDRVGHSHPDAHVVDARGYFYSWLHD